MFSTHFTLTKKHLGFVMVIVGSLSFVGILAVDALDKTREGGIGPAQQIALVLAAFAVVVGLSLIPLGDTPT